MTINLDLIFKIILKIVENGIIDKKLELFYLKILMLDNNQADSLLLVEIKDTADIDPKIANFYMGN